MNPGHAILAAAAFMLGAALAAGLTYLHFAVQRNYWLEMWKASEALRAKDRAERAGELDTTPATFRAPPLPLRPVNVPRSAPPFMRRLFDQREPR